MGDNYQAVYDAIRSRFHGVDADSVIRDVIRNLGIDHHVSMATDRITQSFMEYERPSVVFRPKVYKDGDQWCVLLGDNIQEGLSAFGDTVSKAMHQFDVNFLNERA